MVINIPQQWILLKIINQNTSPSPPPIEEDRIINTATQEPRVVDESTQEKRIT